MRKTLATPQAADYCGVSSTFLEKARCYSTEGPTFIRLGKRIVYATDDLDAWLCRNRCEPAVERERESALT